MDFDLDKSGNLALIELEAFRAVNILGLQCALRVECRDAATMQKVVLQIGLTSRQCRELAERLDEQASIIEQERPSAKQ